MKTSLLHTLCSAEHDILATVILM